MPTSAVSPAVQTEFLTFGPVHLDVVEKNASVAWWRDLVGLQVLGEQEDTSSLGIDAEPLIVLRAGSARLPVRRGYTGLYHLAINLPDEIAFAQVLARLEASRTPLGTTDHVVARSLYLADPDGIGLELTVETPQRVRSIEWPSTATQPEIIDVDGRARSGLEPLDHADVLAKLPRGAIPRSLPTGTRVGHVHLKVADLAASYAFYHDRIGLIPSHYAPLIGFGDLGTGDSRLHRVALNTWEGVGLPPRPAHMAGMHHFTIKFDSHDRLQEALRALEGAEPRDGGYLAIDPAGNELLLSA
jgi:catechol 2,3-dioxygenase